MAEEVAQINVRIPKRLEVEIRKVIKAKAKEKYTTFNLTDFMIEAATEYIEKHGQKHD